MRKSTKVAVLVLALVALCSLTAMAKGWVWSDADAEWTYEDSYGERVFLEWKKDTNGLFYYLGEDGLMVRDQLIEEGNDTYYVGSDGAKITSSWKQIEADDLDADLGVDYRWYYFGSNGKAVKSNGSEAKSQTYNGEKYYFDVDGKMLFGYNNGISMASSQDDPFQDDCVYYCGTNEDGAMKKNVWYKIDVANTDITAYDDVTSYWVFFGKNGKKAVDGEYGVLWNGKRYYFEPNGKMMYEWSVISTDSTKNAYLNGADEGYMAKKQWVWTKKNPSGKEYDDPEWYWINADGTTDAATKVKKINGKYYAFGDDNAMLAGVVELNDEEEGIVNFKVIADVDPTTMSYNEWIKSTGSYYYFSGDKEKDGSLKMSAAFDLELADDTYKATTNKQGKLVSGVLNKKFYINGLLIAADPDFRYEIKSVLDEVDGKIIPKQLLVNTAGSAVKAGAIVADAEGNYWYVNKDDTEDIYQAPAYAEYASRAAQAFKKAKEDKADGTFKVGTDTYKVYEKEVEGKLYTIIAYEKVK